MSTKNPPFMHRWLYVTKKVYKQKRITNRKRKFVTIQEAADYLRVGERTIRKYIDLGILKTTRRRYRSIAPHKQIMIVRQSVIDLLNNNTINRSDE